MAIKIFLIKFLFIFIHKIGLVWLVWTGSKTSLLNIYPGKRKKAIGPSDLVFSEDYRIGYLTQQQKLNKPNCFTKLCSRREWTIKSGQNAEEALVALEAKSEDPFVQRNLSWLKKRWRKRCLADRYKRQNHLTKKLGITQLEKKI